MAGVGGDAKFVNFQTRYKKYLPFDYGDYIIVEGCNGKYDGIWQVKDTMNERFRNRIDFLQSKGTKLNKFVRKTLHYNSIPPKNNEERPLTVTKL